MRVILAAAVACLATGAASAQPAAWKDPTGRISFDLAGTTWSLFPRDNAPNDVILNIVPKDALNGGEITRICSLEYKTQPHDRAATQEEANNVLRRLQRMDELAAPGDGRNPGIVVMHDGVAMQEIERPTTNPETASPGVAIRRDFMLPGKGILQYVGLNCSAFESGGPNAVAEIRDLMARMRIAP